CTKRVAHRWEPADPSDEADSKKRADAAMEKLLKESVLHFQFDDASLSTSDQTMLQKVAQGLRTRPWIAIKVAGHTDERGADAARSYLMAVGVAENQIEPVSLGEEVAAMKESTEEAWACNRRDEMGI